MFDVCRATGADRANGRRRGQDGASENQPAAAMTAAVKLRSYDEYENALDRRAARDVQPRVVRAGSGGRLAGGSRQRSSAAAADRSHRQGQQRGWKATLLSIDQSPDRGAR